MKLHYSLKATCFAFLLMITTTICAQNNISFDASAVRNMHSNINGLNISCFRHFNEHLSGGLEVNRFFPSTKKEGEETLRLSAWDYDLNFHYLLPLHNNLKFYPLSGISFTSEKEHRKGFTDEGIMHAYHKSFFSFNTGAGVLCEFGKWSPHIECSFTWGSTNQQFLLAGVSYEMEWGHHENEKHKAGHH